MKPWTQRLSVAWPRSLRFFEYRYEVLNRLEAAKLLRQLSVAENRIAVRLGDANHALAFTSTRLELALLQRTADVERVRVALEAIFELLQPTRLLRPELVFQWVDPVDDEYDAARAKAARMIFPLFGEDLTDLALLCDGHREEEAVTFRLECGIAEAAELPIRLSRLAGQLAARQIVSIEAEPTLWPREGLPDVAFFCDSLWQPERTVEPGVAGLFHLWEGTQAVAERVVSRVMEEFGLRSNHE